MSDRYEKARAIAEAAANRWNAFGDTAGVNWLTDAIMGLPASSASYPPGLDDRDLCECRIGQCRALTERCRESDAPLASRSLPHAGRV